MRKEHRRQRRGILLNSCGGGLFLCLISLSLLGAGFASWTLVEKPSGQLSFEADVSAVVDPFLFNETKTLQYSTLGLIDEYDRICYEGSISVSLSLLVDEEGDCDLYSSLAEGQTSLDLNFSLSSSSSLFLFLSGIDVSCSYLPIGSETKAYQIGEVAKEIANTKAFTSFSFSSASFEGFYGLGIVLTYNFDFVDEDTYSSSAYSRFLSPLTLEASL